MVCIYKLHLFERAKKDAKYSGHTDLEQGHWKTVKAN